MALEEVALEEVALEEVATEEVATEEVATDKEEDTATAASLGVEVALEVLDMDNPLEELGGAEHVLNTLIARNICKYVQ